MSHIGRHLITTLFGASHGPSVGVVLHGLPAGERIDAEALSRFLERRRPGGSLVTRRNEPDTPEMLSGLVDGVTCGSPLAAVIRNKEARSSDYDAFRRTPRPSHADLVALLRHGPAVDIRGGGAFSGRLTAGLAVAGGIALQLLERRGIRVGAHLKRVGSVVDDAFHPTGANRCLIRAARENALAYGMPMCSAKAAGDAARLVEDARSRGDSLGAEVECVVEGVPAGLGDALFGGIDADLARMVFSIPAVKGFQMGEGFGAVEMTGSGHNDPHRMAVPEEERRLGTPLLPRTNHAGGVVGGITTGAPILFSCAFKPAASIAMPQETASLDGSMTTLVVKGRHDPVVGIRAVPVVEAAAALVVLDALLGDTERWHALPLFDEPVADRQTEAHRA